LSRAQPVERGIEVVFIDRGQPARLAERAVLRLGGERPRGRQFGPGLEHSGGDQRDGPITRPTRRRVKEAIEAESRDRAQDRHHVPVRQRARDRERLGQGRADGGRALQDLPERLDFGRGPGG
jgi:hypothetical protein